MIETGINIYTSDLITETISAPVRLTRSFDERWIEPLLHPVTVPFEPWVREKSTTMYYTVPSESIMQVPGGFICHPTMRQRLEAALIKRLEEAAASL
jgi:hypothetical protein